MKAFVTRYSGAASGSAFFGRHLGKRFISDSDQALDEAKKAAATNGSNSSNPWKRPKSGSKKEATEEEAQEKEKGNNIMEEKACVPELSCSAERTTGRCISSSTSHEAAVGDEGDDFLCAAK